MYAYNNITIFPLDNGLCIAETTEKQINSGQPKSLWGFGSAAIGGRKAVQAVSPLFGAEQAEVGQSPTCLPHATR